MRKPRQTLVKGPTSELEIYSWWAGDKGPALQALIDQYSEMYPDVEVINATVAGGSGIEAKAVLKIRILGADPPDSFQVHAGQELIGTWVVADCMEDLTFLFAVTLTSGTGNEPITVAMSNLAGGRAVQWNLPMTGTIMAALPTLIVYVLLGRYFIRGLLAGSVKG